MHPPDFERRMQTTWGGNWHPHKRKAATALSTRTGKERSPSDLAQIDERNVGLCRVKPDGTVEGLVAEDVQADFIRSESTLGPNIPAKIRERFVAARDFVAYGWFKYEFYTVAVFWSLSCLEMALRLKFSETHPGPLTLIRKKASEVVAFHEVEERVKHGWHIEGMPAFNFSLHSLLIWAQEADFLLPGTNIKAVLTLRNSMAHPSHFNWVVPAGNSLEVFRLVIGTILRLWPH